MRRAKKTLSFRPKNGMRPTQPAIPEPISDEALHRHHRLTLEQAQAESRLEPEEDKDRLELL